MAKKDIKVHIDLHEQELQNAKMHEVAAPTFEGHEVFDVAGNRRHIQVNATQETYAFLSDLTGTAGDIIVSGAVTGNDLILTQADAGTITIDVSSLIDDSNLARITSGAMNGTNLELLRDDNTTILIDLVSLDQSAGVTQNASDISTNGTAIGVNAAATVANAAAIAAIEDDHVLSGVLNGTNDLVLTMNQGGTVTVPLAGLIDDTNLARITSAAVSGTDLTLTRDDASTIVVDLSSAFDDTNLPFIQSGAITGTDLVLTRNDASTVTIDVTGLGTAAAFERQTVNLVANTPLTVTAANITDIHSIQVYDSAGEEITVRIAKGAGLNERILESNVAEPNVVVEMTGVA